MWKIALAFIVFAALAMFVLIKTGADIDMGGEQHGAGVHPAETPAAAASAASTPR